MIDPSGEPYERCVLHLACE